MDFNATLMIKLLLTIRYKFGYTVPNIRIESKAHESHPTYHIFSDIAVNNPKVVKVMELVLWLMECILALLM